MSSITVKQAFVLAFAMTSVMPAADARPVSTRIKIARGAPSQSPRLAFAISTDVVGLNPAYVERRLGIPRVKDRNSLIFEVAGCTIDYSIDGTVIRSFTVRLSKRCEPSFRGVRMRSNTTIGAVLDRGKNGQLIASCLTGCGNAADPIVELSYPGTRMNGMIAISYWSEDGNTRRVLSKWEKSVRKQFGLGEFEAPDDYEPFSCVTPPPQELVESIRMLSITTIHVSADDGEGKC